jgi:3-oxoacyl-[acyl-carrier-protein] synthase-3
MPIRVAGWGSAVPARRVTNQMLEATLDTSDEWIVARTGIRERHIATDDETTLPLAIAAARRALERAGASPDSVDLVVVATCTAEQPMPSTASSVAAALGTTAGGFDVDGACAGFVQALLATTSMLRCGLADRALVIGADTMSRVVDPTDRATAVLFGDGAGAVLLEATPNDVHVTAGAAGGPFDRRPTAGLLAADVVTDGDGASMLCIPAGGAARPLTAERLANREQYLRMDGPALFHRVVRGVATSVQRTLDRAGATVDDVRWFVPHQANARIVDAVAARLGLDAAQIAANGERLGNTSAASIPLLLAELADADPPANGDLILLSGFGAGLSVASALWRWEHT